MAPGFNTSKKHRFFRLVAFGLLFFMVSGCGDTRNDIFTIGIASWIPSGSRQLDGFKDGMAALNYVEGQNVKYICETISGDSMYDIPTIDAKLDKLLSQNLDLLLVIGQEVTVQAKKLGQATRTPIIFGGTAWPVESGFVKSLGHPGGDMTGVRFVNSVPKALEWLVSIGGVKKVYIPYNPDDEVSVISMEGLEETAHHLDIELILHKVYSVVEAAAAIENLPENIDAIYRIPSPTLDPENSKLSEAAIRRRLPMVSSNHLDNAVLATFGNDEFNIGEKLAWLAQQIERGSRPADLPVQTAEVFLTVNLDTAEKIGLQLPDEIIVQAKKIIR